MGVTIKPRIITTARSGPSFDSPAKRFPERFKMACIVMGVELILN